MSQVDLVPAHFHCPMLNIEYGYCHLIDWKYFILIGEYT